MSNILVVEDEPDLASLITYNLKQACFDVEVAHTGMAAIERATSRTPQLVILDWMLPDISGVEVCRQLKKEPRTASASVVMLTARREETDRLAGFQAGVDDYVAKPFSVLELMLRVKAILRRHGEPEVQERIISVGTLRLDVPEHRCFVNGAEVPLTLLEFRLLLHLMQHPGRVRSREQLLEEVWQLRGSLETRTVDTHMNRLRQKLSEARDYFETVRGVGYRMIAPRA